MIYHYYTTIIMMIYHYYTPIIMGGKGKEAEPAVIGRGGEGKSHAIGQDRKVVLTQNPGGADTRMSKRLAGGKICPFAICFFD